MGYMKPSPGRSGHAGMLLMLHFADENSAATLIWVHGLSWGCQDVVMMG